MPVNPASHEFTIGDNIFYVRRFPPFQALEILGDLQKQFAGPLISQIDGKESPRDAEGNIVLNGEASKKLMESFTRISEKLDGKTLRNIAQTLIDPNCISVSINGDNPRRLDVAAQGLVLESVADIITICWEVLKFNYAEVITRISSPTGPARLLMRK